MVLSPDAGLPTAPDAGSSSASGAPAALGSLQGLVFDLDGVLILSRDAHRRAFEEVFAPFGVNGFDYDRYAGWRTREVFHSVFTEMLTPPPAEHIIAECALRKSALARQFLAREESVAPECVSIIRRLALRYSLALASSGSRESVYAFLDRTGLHGSFHSVLSGDDVQLAKPDPEIFSRSIRALGLHPYNCAVIEDAPSGIQAALLAGATPIGMGDEGALTAAGAACVVSSLSELEQLLQCSRKGASPSTVDRTDWVEHAAPSVDRSLWTAVIPAAGKGTRLGYDLPKILFPVAERPILQWLLDLLLPVCKSVVLVLSPDGREPVEAEMEKIAPGRCRVAIQPSPTGMGDAVEIGAAEVTTPHTAVLWGDQVAIRPASVDSVFRLHQGPHNPDLTVPTVFRDSPYIHFERDEAGRIVRLLQAREGDSLPPRGESDTGFFCFRTDALRRMLAEMRGSGTAFGKQTGEFNFLPVIPFASASGRYVLTPRLMDFEETIGVNSRADAESLELFLRRTT